MRCDATAGLLLLQHASGSIDDDLLAIAVRDGRVELVLNLGKNRPRDPLVIRSSVIVADRRWHTIIFARCWRLEHSILTAVVGTVPGCGRVVNEESSKMNSFACTGNFWSWFSIICVSDVLYSVFPIVCLCLC